MPIGTLESYALPITTRVEYYRGTYKYIQELGKKVAYVTQKLYSESEWEICVQGAKEIKSFYRREQNLFVLVAVHDD